MPVVALDAPAEDLIAYARQWLQHTGQIIVFFVLAVAAAIVIIIGAGYFARHEIVAAWPSARSWGSSGSPIGRLAMSATIASVSPSITCTIP